VRLVRGYLCETAERERERERERVKSARLVRRLVCAGAVFLGALALIGCAVDGGGNPPTGGGGGNGGGAPGVTITPTTLSVDENASATYTVKLNTQPSGDATITPASNNSDVTFVPATLTFSNSNWSTAQSITVSAEEDADADNETATITHSVSGYSATIPSVAVAVADDDTRGITITPMILTLDEGGKVKIYTVRLNTQPSGDVTITATSDNGDIVFLRSARTFTSSNWRTEQQIELFAASDSDTTDEMATITHSVTGYEVATIPSVVVTVTDRPHVVSTTPTSGVIGVAVDTDVVFTFDQNISANSGTIQIIALTGTGTTITSISVTDSQVMVNGKTVTINPTSDLVPNTTYLVALPADGFRTASGTGTLVRQITFATAE